MDLAAPLQLPEVSLPLPPYALGVWLGDGESGAPEIVLPAGKRQIGELLQADGIAITIQPRKGRADDATLRMGGDTILGRLRALGVLNSKHIPSAYLRGSHGQRLALLQGLMDTDGSCANGQCEFSTTTAALARGTTELLRTLGYKPSVIETRAMLNGRDCGPAWRSQFFAYREELPVFRLERKRLKLPSRPSTRPLSRGRMIVACDPIDSVPEKCIKVAAPSGLFLAGEGLIPTHNTPMLAGMGLYGLVADEEPGAQIFAAAVSRDQAKILFEDARKMAWASLDLARRLEILEHNIAFHAEGSFFRPVSSEARTLDAKRVHMALIDEIHEHPSSLVVDKLRAGTKGANRPSWWRSPTLATTGSPSATRTTTTR